MDFRHTEERRMLEDSITRFLEKEYPLTRRNQAAASDLGYDREIWEQMAELGVFMALFDEEHGGFGGKGFDIALVFEALGHVTGDWPRGREHRAGRRGPAPLPMSLQQVLTADIIDGINEHQIEPLIYEAAGQSIAWFNELRTVSEIVDHLVAETESALEDMAAMLGLGLQGGTR